MSVATLPDGQIVTTAVQATSPGFTKSWTDGTGQQWEDVLAHVALTPEPVWADQPAFEIAFAKRKDAEVFYLALPKDPTTKVASKLSKPPPDKDAEDETEDVVPDPLDGAVPAEKNDDESRCDRLKVLLAKVGCTLPADTTTENIAERLEVALGVLIQKVAADNAKKQAEKQEKDAASQGNQPTEAPSPSMMMSHPVTRRIILDEVDRRKSEAIKRIESLKLRGVPVHEANQMIADVSSVTMSVSKTGQLSRLPIDAELDRLERIMPPAEKFDLLSKTKPLSSPIQKNEGDGEEMVVHKASGLPMPKSTLDSIKEIAHR